MKKGVSKSELAKDLDISTSIIEILSIGLNWLYHIALAVFLIWATIQIIGICMGREFKYKAQKRGVSVDDVIVERFKGKKKKNKIDKTKKNK